MTDAGISEKFSKNRRGRPYILNGVFENCKNDSINREIVRGKTNRTYQNEMYLSIVYPVIGNDRKQYEWLFGIGAFCKGRKKTVLTEIGRIYALTNDDDIVKQIAKKLCDEKPLARDAVRFLREIRLECKRAGEP